MSSVIPKTIHIIWVGDESRRPNNCIETWKAMNPDWAVRIWGNQELAEYGWVNAEHMRAMYASELNGVADLMRWEILYNEGGFVVDADSICVRPLEDWLLEGECFACWENEVVRPGLVAAGYVGSVPNNPFMGQLILDLNAKPSVLGGKAWETVGPLFLTESFRKYEHINLTVHPSHYFIPRHYTGKEYSGDGVVFAKQAWASTKVSYDQLHLLEDLSVL